MPKDTALHKAAHKGEMDNVEAALDGGTDINAEGAQNRCAIHRAIGGGHARIVEFLIEKGADIHKVDKGGKNPMHWCAVTGNVECSNLVIKGGGAGDVNKTSKSGQTPLHMAAEGGKNEFVQHLVANGAEVDTKDGDGMTAFDLAKKMGHKDVMSTLQPGGGGGGGCCIMQ
jgi:ankyrin repeat protein